MIVRFFKSGTSDGKAAVAYLLGQFDHKGEHRAEAPEVLSGSPALTLKVIQSIGREHKFASGCIAFRLEEQPTKEQLLAIMDRFRGVTGETKHTTTTKERRAYMEDMRREINELITAVKAIEGSLH